METGANARVPVLPLNVPFFIYANYTRRVDGAILFSTSWLVIYFPRSVSHVRSGHRLLMARIAIVKRLVLRLRVVDVRHAGRVLVEVVER